VQAVRQAIRVVRSNPGFGALVVLILAAGIGATTAALNVAASVLLTPLPVNDDSRLVLITKRLPAGSAQVPFTPAEMTAWGDGARTFESVGGVQYDGAWPWPAELGDRALTVTGTAVSGNFFDVLAARPVAGRLLVASDAQAGSEEVAVIGYGLWRRQFGGDPGVAGQKIRLNGRSVTIVGVAPPGFTIPKGADVWQPLVNTPDAVNDGWFNLVARLKTGATLDQAIEESTALLDRFRATSPRHSPHDIRTAVVPLKETIVGGLRPVIGLFVAAAVLLFLVGCLNVMTLLLVRGTMRERELAVCSALGATRSRLITQLMAEAAILATAGGAAGAFVAFWLQRLLLAAAPAGVPRLDQVGFDGLTLGLTFAATLAGALLAGIAPAIVIVPRNMFSGLRGSSGNTRRQLGGQILVAAQLAFALIVTIGAALLVRSLQQLQSVDPGFALERLHAVQVPLVGRAYDEPERRRQLFDALVSRLETLPGIAAATPVLLRPFTGIDGWNASFTREGQDGREASANPGLHLESVWPDYFSTIGTPILRGRAFTESDRKDSPPVAIISESLARNGWPKSSAVGKRIKFGPADSPAPWMTVIGIVGDLRYRDLKAPPPAIYVPADQTSFPARFLLVRASVDAAPVLAMTQRALREIDPGEPVTEAAPIAALLDGELAGPRFYMSALSLLAAVAVLLAGVGVFGVLGAFVAQRSAEVGLRVALGATVVDIRRLVLSRIGWPAILGLSVGTCAAIAAAPQLGPLLFHVSARDAPAFAAGWAVLALVSLAAATIPLRRACRVDPVSLLRHEG
jgi:putative ABC transport system permease protein